LRKAEVALTLLWALLSFTVTGLKGVNLANANPIPPVDPEIRIDSVQNATFTADSISVNFTGEANWNTHAYYYSLDNQSFRRVENVTIVSKEQVNPGRNPEVYRTTVQGICIFYNLSEGWHNAIIYNIASQSFTYNFPQYAAGDIMCQAEYFFNIQKESPSIFPTTQTEKTFTVLAILAIVTMLSVSSLVYFKKHKERKTRLRE
jgi:hypothetical protein